MLDSVHELLAKIRLGEDSILELKAVQFRGQKIVGPGRDDLADELAALANSSDGVLVLGVDDRTREVVGIPSEAVPEVEKYVREVCNDKIDPPLDVRIILMELPDLSGTLRVVVKVDVPKSLFVHRSPGGYLRRQGSSKRVMRTEQLARLLQQRSQARLIRFDEQAVPETRPEDLDEELAARFLAGSEQEPAQALRKLRLVVPDDTGAERCSVAGILLCTREPGRWIRSAAIEAVRYRGDRQDSNYQLDARTITGPLDEQVDLALGFVRRNMTRAARKDPARVEIPQFSERACFEALVNAVAHRDYSVHGSRARLFMFDDRLELYSPGALPNTLTIDSLPLRQSTRNELVTSLLARCPVPNVAGGPGRRFLMERRGDGVPIIFAETEKLAGRKPSYSLIDDAELLLVIPAAGPSAVDSDAAER